MRFNGGLHDGKKVMRSIRRENSPISRDACPLREKGRSE
jgi:hypothetical protein